MRAKKYENGSRITTRQMRSYDKRVSPTREAMLRLERETSEASIKRAMREMGFDIGPDDELDNPPESLLREKGMTQDEFFDEVYKRAREYAVTPIYPREAPRVELDERSIQMPGDGERTMAREARGGMGASATEDLLERLNQYKRNAYGNKYEQGGEVKKKGSTIKIAGQYAYEPIATTESGEQYVTMELPDGTMATVFGDWETYGNPSQEGYIEDLDYIIYPLGDGTYALDVAEAETEMLREESREVSRQAGTEVEDLLQELNQRGGMGFTPSGRMRPVKKQ